MKISTDGIQGFSEMSDSDKVNALLGLDIPDPVDLTGYVKKAVFDAKASEAAKLSQELKTKMSAEEAAQAQAEIEKNDLQEKYNELLRKATIAEHTAQYISLGYDEGLAHSTAEALFDGNMEKVFQNQKSFNQSMEKSLKAEIMRNTPTPSGSGEASEKKDENVEFAKLLGKKKSDTIKESIENRKKYYR